MNDKVILGRFGAVHGVRGWLRVISFTQPIDNILNYPEWHVQHLGTWKTIINPLSQCTQHGIERATSETISLTPTLSHIRRGGNRPAAQQLYKAVGGGECLLIEAGKIHGKSIIVKIEAINDREQAQVYTNDDIAIDGKALPKLNKDEHYWKDLIGMSVITKDGTALGTITNLLETGANDVLIVTGDRERMIPYTKQTVESIDTEKKTIIVDWDPEF